MVGLCSFKSFVEFKFRAEKKFKIACLSSSVYDSFGNLKPPEICEPVIVEYRVRRDKVSEQIGNLSCNEVENTKEIIPM